MHSIAAFILLGAGSLILVIALINLPEASATDLLKSGLGGGLLIAAGALLDVFGKVYYYKDVDGKVYGPFTPQTIRRLIAHSQIGPRTLLSRFSSEQWAPLSHFRMFAQAAAKEAQRVL